MWADAPGRVAGKAVRQPNGHFAVHSDREHTMSKKRADHYANIMALLTEDIAMRRRQYRARHCVFQSSEMGGEAARCHRSSAVLQRAGGGTAMNVVR